MIFQTIYKSLPHISCEIHSFNRIAFHAGIYSYALRSFKLKHEQYLSEEQFIRWMRKGDYCCCLLGELHNCIPCNAVLKGKMWLVKRITHDNFIVSLDVLTAQQCPCNYHKSICCMTVNRTHKCRHLSSITEICTTKFYMESICMIVKYSHELCRQTTDIYLPRNNRVGRRHKNGCFITTYVIKCGKDQSFSYIWPLVRPLLVKPRK